MTSSTSSNGLLWIIAAIGLGALFLLNRNSNAGGYYAGGFTGAGGGDYGGTDVNPTPYANGGGGGTTTRSSSPTITSFQDPRLTYEGVLAFQQATGRTPMTGPTQQGFGGPGATPGVRVPIIAAFGFGGDATNPDGSRNRNYQLERRAGLRNELVASAPQATAPHQELLHRAALEARADKRTEQAYGPAAHQAHAAEQKVLGGTEPRHMCGGAADCVGRFSTPSPYPAGRPALDETYVPPKEDAY